MPPGKWDIKPGNIKVVAGEPIRVEGLTTDDVQTLKQKRLKRCSRFINRIFVETF